jgi:A/G-specific adenine glycosylase
LKKVSKILLAWHEHQNFRQLPWKEETDVYKIWLSEVLLQQTRAAQALPYYLAFLDNYPAIRDLAVANEQEVFKLWQGLGYYNRCRNMLATARKVHHELNSIFPSNYSDLLQLKGIGPYSAAAIASFAFNEAVAVLDGNVYRVLSRYFGIDTPIDTSTGIALFRKLAQDLLAKDQPKKYNQAIMDFGATICTPKAPKCKECPFSAGCLALKADLVNVLPVKSKKVAVKQRHFHFLVFDDGQQIYLQKRDDSDIWANLWQPFLVESENENFIAPTFLNSTPELFFTTKQKLTHQLIFSYFYRVEASAKLLLKENLLAVSYQEIEKYAFPKTCLDMIAKYYR